MKFDYQSIIENLPAYCFLIDRNETIRYVNRVAKYVKKEDILGISLSTIFEDKDEYERISSVVKEVFESDKEKRIDIFIDNSRWKKLWFSTNLVPYPHKGKEVDFILGINLDNSRLIKAKHRAEINEQKFRSIIEGTPTNVMLIDEEYTISYFNRTSSLPNLGNDIVGKSVFSFMGDNDRERMRAIFEKVKETGITKEYEIGGYHPITGFKWYRGSCAMIKTENSEIQLIIQFYNITSKRLEEIQTKEFNQKLEELVETRTAELQKANKEIRVLLKEMHHRVKNNLQIVSSLLSFQSSFVSEELQPVLAQSKERIQSISVIHEMLYKNDSLSNIKIDKYLDRLINNHLAYLHGKRKVDYQIKIDMDKKELDIESMIPIGLLVNELVTNSAKHAFRDTAQPIISILLSRIDANTIALIYKDNGLGMEVNPQKSTLGLELISCFVDQLDGTMQMIPEKEGVHYSFRLKVS